MALLPLPPANIEGCKVLDLGCGQGWTCRWVREMGATIAHGVDISEEMLASARYFPSDPTIKYERFDLETVALPNISYNLVISSHIRRLYYLLDPGRICHWICH